MAECKICGRGLTSDEVGLHKKLINKEDTSCMCLTCLARFFECDEELLRRKIIYFRNMGCMLFQHKADEQDGGS